MMQALTNAAMLALWERGRHRGPAERALILLGAAFPATAEDDCAQITVGERDAAVLALRRATFGSRLASYGRLPALRRAARIRARCCASARAHGSAARNHARGRLALAPPQQPRPDRGRALRDHRGSRADAVAAVLPRCRACAARAGCDPRRGRAGDGGGAGRGRYRAQPHLRCLQPRVARAFRHLRLLLGGDRAAGAPACSTTSIASPVSTAGTSSAFSR